MNGTFEFRLFLWRGQMLNCKKTLDICHILPRRRMKFSTNSFITKILDTRSLGGSPSPNFYSAALRASLTSSFAAFGRSGRVTHTDVSMMHSVCMMQLKFCDGYSRSRMYDARTGHLWTNKAFPKIVAVSLHHKYNWIQCVRIWWWSWRFLTNLGFVQVCALKTLGLSR